MAFKFSPRFSIVWSTLAIAGGCSQVLGLNDYGVDPSLGAGGGASTDGGENSTGGKNSPLGGDGPSHGGEPNVQPGGAPNMPQGGEPNMPQGGEPNMPQAGNTSIGGGGDGSIGGGGAGGATTLGEVVPCDSADCCTTLGGKAVGVELLKDGGFETGTPDDGSPWSEATTTDGIELIFNDLSLGFTPKAGDYFAYLSGIASEDSTVYQYVVVPKDAGWLVVSGYRLFQIDSQDDTNKDFGAITVYSYPAGEAVEAPFYWGRPSDSTDGWGNTSTWKFFQASWDATPHQGLKRDIEFRGASDDYSTDPDLSSSSYLFDELSLKAFRCYK